ncbi:uncharacterized protein N7469_000678 [Penicillium citrinum]|uniref:Bromo domain-containing protein n=1 Tax=Penicillium citrinum TaxID=5077 RepID=A0A9W9TUY4_PENCI|nr:uncharacterized protein N7469_000678 [Penicillium citrinum]KAJ5242351.1 hypothetical protein N7469_000678 [Penicillium citrinum]
MSTKRRSAVAASPEVKVRSGKRRKVSDESIVEPEDFQLADEADDAEEEDLKSEEEGDPESFEGNTIQAAQDKIVSELTRLKDSDGEEVAYPFVGKPDRNLYRDYYEIIQHPVSLRSIQAKVRGNDSRKNPTRITAFPTWQSFEEEVSYLWRNAREYNEEGSDITVLAGILEDYFKRRVIEAKKLVPDSIQVDGDPETPRIKLKMGTKDSEPSAQRLTLKMSGQTSETPSKEKPPSGVAVDNDALKRQKEHVRTGSTSQDIEAPRSPRTRSLRRHPASPRSSVATTPSASEQPSNGRASAHVKDESVATSSQQPDTRSSHGPQGTSHGSTGGLPPHEVPVPAPVQPPPEVSPLDSIWRRPGQNASAALIQNVQISTHPSLSLRQDLCLEIPPSATVRQQTITITLPPSHRILTVKPTLIASTAERQTKLVALMGTHRLHSSGDASTLAYDIQLHPGTTKVDLEAIAGPPRGAPKTGPPGSDLDYERVTIFFNLLR